LILETHIARGKGISLQKSPSSGRKGGRSASNIARWKVQKLR